MLFSWFQHAVGDVGLGRRAVGALVSESPDHMCCHEIGDRPRRMGASWDDSASEFHHYSYVVFQMSERNSRTPATFPRPIRCEYAVTYCRDLPKLMVTRGRVSRPGKARPLQGCIGHKI